MSDYTSYYLYQKYQKIGTGDWTPVSPSVFSVNGEGTMPLSAKTENDPNCGYSPEALYRWVNMDISTDYYCLDCGTDGFKINGELASGGTFSVECSNSSTLTSGDTNSYYDMSFAQIGSCVNTIESWAMAAKTYLTGVSIPSSVVTIGDGAFAYSTALYNCVLPTSITTIGGSAFSNCTSLAKIILWDNITSIGTSAFTNCDSITFINIPTGLTDISDYCFYDCGALSEINIPNGVTSIGKGAFRNCSAITTCAIGSGVTRIGTSAFTNCNDMRSIEIPSGVTRIDDYAFDYCSGLTSVTVNAVTPPRLGNYTFHNTFCPIYVPAESVDIYKVTQNWASYANRITAIPNS